MKLLKLYIYIIPVAIVFFASCKSTKKITTAINKKDTAAPVVVQEKEADKTNAMKEEILKKIQSNKIDYEWFWAKIKADYDDNSGENNNFNVMVKMKKDSIIWLSITKKVLGIDFEGMRVLVTKDSVKLLNKQDKAVQYRSIAYLQELTQLPFDFNTLQDLILGNPIFFTSNIVSLKQNDQQVLALSVGDLFKHLITVDIVNGYVAHSKLDDVNIVRNRTCDITFFDYETKKGKMFSTNRNITVTEKSKLDIHLNYKQYSFNEPQTFPFNVPKNYDIK